MRHITYAAVPVLLVAATSGCSSSDSADKPSGGVVEAKAETAVAWADRNWKQKQAFMKEVVQPEMGALLTGRDAEEFPEVTCKTCHGADPMASKFKMPSPELPALDPTDKFAGHFADDPEMTKFMMETFNPKMIELLGVEPWSMDNQEGFGCFSCHTMKQAAPAAMDAARDRDATTEAGEAQAAE